MKKILFGVVGLVLVLAAAVLIGPGLIDWNDYREQIAARAEAEQDLLHAVFSGFR